jgi:hypothetical protein
MAPDPGHAVVVRVELRRAIGVVLDRRIPHRAELQQAERAPILAEALLGEEHAARTIDLDGHRDRGERGGQRRQAAGGERVVERALDEVGGLHARPRSASKRS